MLSEIQFHHIVNNVLNLDCCRLAGLNLLDIDETQNERVAVFALGASKHAVWKIVNRGEKVIMVAANGTGLFRMSFNDDLSPDKATVAELEQLIKTMSYTLLNVINIILSGMYSYQKDPSYYLDYPNIDDFYNTSESSAILVKFPGEGNALRLSDADRIPEMNKNITEIKYIILDVIGTRSIPAIGQADSDSKQPTNTVTSPLFRLVIKDGVLAYTRYTNRDGIKVLDEETGDIDFVKMTPEDYQQFIKTSNPPRLSSKTTKINIQDAVTKTDDPEQMATDPKYKPVELSNIILHDIDRSWTKDDKTSASTRFTEAGTIALIGYRPVLKKKNCLISNPNAHKYIPPASMVGYVLDDYLNCYPINPNEIHIGVTRGAEYPICISYSSPSGIIAELHITPEESLLNDSDDLIDKSNFFAVTKTDRVLLKYNKGGNQLVSETIEGTRNNIEVAFNIIRDMIAMRAVVDDISRTVYHTLAETQWSEKLLKDEHIATTSVTMNMHDAHVEIHSLLSDRVIPIDIVVRNSDNGGAVINCTMNQHEFTFSAEHRQSIIDQYNMMDEANDEADEPMSLKDKLRTFGHLFGAMLSIDVENCFSRFIQSNRKGMRAMSSENQQENLYNALKFRYGGEEKTILGDLLLDVRDALINTFGENVLGTPTNPSKVSPILNISDFNYSISKPVKTENGNTYEQVNVSFLVNNGSCGAFTASYDRKTKEPKVICQMGGRREMRADHIVNGRVSSQFLQWYLLSRESSSLTQVLLRCIENGRATVYVNDDEGNPTDEIEYQIDPEVVKILAPYARQSYRFGDHPVNKDMGGRAPEMQINRNSILDKSLLDETDDHYAALDIPGETDDNDDQSDDEPEDIDIAD